jgi:glycosyltransferase involved in cell wall biosynthesis
MQDVGTPTVSVVIAAYNAGAYLDATLRSVLDQTYRQIEVVVVVDGATDDTLAIAEQVAADDSRLRVIDLGANLGRSAARNRGLSESNGDWITVSDADDLWAPDRLEALLDAAAKFPGSSLITDDLITFDVGPGGEVTLGHRDSTRATWRLRDPHPVRLREWYIDGACPMNPLIRRELLDATGATYPEHMSAGEDLSFQLELAFSRHCGPTIRVARPLYYYRAGALRAPNMAQSRLLMVERVKERTHSAAFERYVKRSTPGALYRLQRADRQVLEAGRAAPRDLDLDDVPSSKIRGLGQLALGKAVSILSDRVDQGLRPAIVADITRQLAAQPGERVKASS